MERDATEGGKHRHILRKKDLAESTPTPKALEGSKETKGIVTNSVETSTIEGEKVGFLPPSSQ
eukprot:1303294-Ditylum_brightwellii.AAC.1